MFRKHGMQEEGGNTGKEEGNQKWGRGAERQWGKEKNKNKG